MKKSLVLAMAMALGVTASAYAANPFSDVPAGHWAYDSVNKLAAAGVVDGYPDGTYGGDKLMTRYEMAQIVAKAMAKGANVDKLAAEFADELDSLGVRVANLEKKADNVKVTGQIRASYQSYDEGGYTNKLRTRLWVTGQVNEDWAYTGMIQNEQDFKNDAGDEKTTFQRAFVTGKIGGVKVEAGRNNTVLADNNILSHRTDAVKATFGKDVKLTAQYGKLANAAEAKDNTLNDGSKGGDYYAVTLNGKVGKLGLEANYVDVDDVNNSSLEDYTAAEGVDNKIWTVGAKYAFDKNVTVDAMYLNGDKENKSGDSDGYVAGVSYKGAKASKAGSWGLYAKYYDQPAGTYLHHGMNTDLGNDMWKEGGFDGYMVGVKYTFAKNIVGAVEYSDFDAKDTNYDDQTIWSELVFTF